MTSNSSNSSNHNERMNHYKFFMNQCMGFFVLLRGASVCFYEFFVNFSGYLSRTLLGVCKIPPDSYMVLLIDEQKRSGFALLSNRKRGS